MSRTRTARGSGPGSGRRRTAAERRARRLQTRVRTAFLLVAFVLSLFAVRLVQLQGVDAAAYASMAEAESSRTVTLHAARGDVTDRFGTALASSVDAVALAADPTQTADQAPEIAAVLTQRLGLDYFDTVDALRTPDTRFAYLARQVPTWRADRVLETLRSRGLAGVYTERDPLRVYPARQVAANVVGVVGRAGHGLLGVEQTYDEQMAGTDGQASYTVAPDGEQIPLGPSSTVQPVQGDGLRLTLDRDLQYYAQQRLAAAVEKAGGESGSLVLMDVDTGQVLALADYPTYDPNTPGRTLPRDRGSRTVSDVYEPGSVEKILTFGALLDNGSVTPRTHLRVPPSLTFDGEDVHDDFDHGWLHLTPAGVLAKSSNLGTIRAAWKMSAEKLESYLRGFGLGPAPDVGLPGQSDGTLAPASDWMDIQRATIAFGQGLSVSALQIAAAVNAVANDGVYVAPTLVQGATEDGDVVDPVVPEQHRVISDRAAEQVQQMMEGVVASPEGTGNEARIPGYRVAGKTGTSQRVVDGRYVEGQRVISFAGFAPADDPQYMAYVMIDYPKDGSYGGTACAPVFADVMGYALQRYAVEPTHDEGDRGRLYPLTW